MIKSLSIILPVYNESIRLHLSMNEIKKFAKKNIFNSVEIIFVDDGSKDDSLKKINEFVNKFRKNKKIKILKIKSYKNLGKGSALKLGIKKSSKEWIVTVDVDMSVKLSQILTWIKKGYIKNKNSAYFGSRKHQKSKIKAKLYRIFLGNILKYVIFFLLGNKIRDTQCGFKLYNKKYAKNIFNALNTLGYAHDLELIKLLKSKNIKIIELPVNWVHMDKGKLNVLLDPIKMLIDIILIKFRST